MATLDKVKELVAQQLNKSVDEITEDKEVVKDLGADSLDVVEMLMALEDEFGVDIPDEEIEKMKTIGDVVEFIEANK